MPLPQRPMSIVCDHKTRAVLAFPRSPAAAMWTTMGMLDTFFTTIPVDLPHVNLIVKKYNLVNDHLMCSPKAGEHLIPLPENLITDAYLKQRNLARLRSKYIYYQQSHYNMYLSRAAILPDMTTSTYLLRELDKSDPSNNDFSYGLKQYAEILDLTPEEAYDELTIMTDSASAIRMRHFAWFVKNVNQLNKMTSEEEMSEFSKHCWNTMLNDSIL